MCQAVGKPTAMMPPWKATSRYMSAPPSKGTMQARCGGCVAAVNHCTHARYDSPIIPTLPVHHGCAAIHSTVS